MIKYWILFTISSIVLLYSIVMNIKHKIEDDFPDVNFNKLERDKNDELLQSIILIIIVVTCPIIHILFTFYLIKFYDDMTEEIYKKVYPKILNKINKMRGMYQVTKNEPT